MDTITEVVSAEKTQVNGRTAVVVELLGGTKVGTFEQAVGEAALAAQGKSVRVKIRQEQGKAILAEIEELIPAESGETPFDDLPASAADNADVGGPINKEGNTLGNVEAAVRDADGDVSNSDELIASIYAIVSDVQVQVNGLRKIVENEFAALRAPAKRPARRQLKAATKEELDGKKKKPAAKKTTTRKRTTAKK